MRPGKPRGPAGTRRAGGVNIVHVVNFFAMTVGGACACPFADSGGKQNYKTNYAKSIQSRYLAFAT